MKGFFSYFLIIFLVGCRSPSGRSPVDLERPDTRDNGKQVRDAKLEPKQATLVEPGKPRPLALEIPCSGLSDSEREGCIVSLLRLNCLGQANTKERLLCLGDWMKLYPDDTLTVASLLISSQDDPASILFALDILRNAENSDSKAMLLADLVLLALSLDKLNLAEDALGVLESSVAGRSRYSTLPLRADLLQKQGRWTEAVAAYKDLLAANPLFEGYMADVVEAMIRAGSPENVASLCTELARDTDRTLQALACLRIAVENGMMPPKSAYTIALRLLGRFPGLSSEELKRLAPARLPMLATVEECERGVRPPSSRLLRDRALRHPRSNVGLESAVYSGLAAVEEDRRVQYCFQGHAARTCAASLSGSGECSDLRSIAVFIRSIAHEEGGPTVRAIIESIEGRRRGPFIKLGNALDIHSGGSPAAVALYEVHMMLAYEIQADPEIAGKHHTAGWHARVAIDSWRRIDPPMPFPIAVLDDVILDTKANGTTLREYIVQSKMLTASTAG